MIGRHAALLALLAVPATGQLVLNTIPGPGIEEPVGRSLDLGSVPTGSFGETKLRLRNKGEVSVTLERLRVTGTGFSLDGHPSVPHVVAPAGNVDFRVRFQPTGEGSFSGVLRVNDAEYLLFGTSPPTITLLVNDGGAYRPVITADPIVFGPVLQGQTFTRALRLENPSRKTVALDVFRVDGSHYSLAVASPPPPALAPGATLDFEVRYNPVVSGLHRGTLVVNQRFYFLDGFATHPPFSEPEILLNPASPASAAQATVAVRLGAPAPAPASGRIAMAFQPATTGGFDDPAIQFVASGKRSLPLSVEAGETTVLIDGRPEAVFQTGTTTGTITFTTELADRSREARLTIAPALVEITAERVEPSPGGIALRFHGYDNTHTLFAASFLFFDTSGHPLTPEPLRVNVAKAFQDYYATSYVGGVFALTASFPVAGNPALLGEVEVQFSNSAGPAPARRIRLR